MQICLPTDWWILCVQTSYSFEMLFFFLHIVQQGSMHVLFYCHCSCKCHCADCRSLTRLRTWRLKWSSWRRQSSRPSMWSSTPEQESVLYVFPSKLQEVQKNKTTRENSSILHSFQILFFNHKWQHQLKFENVFVFGVSHFCCNNGRRTIEWLRVFQRAPHT